jgi:hypothetical protein
MTLEFNLTKEDLSHFTYYTSWAAPEKKQYRIQYYLKTIGYSFVGVLVLYFIERPENIILFFSIGMAVAVIWGVISVYFAIEKRFKNRIKKFAEDENNAAFYSKTELTLTETGIINQDENSEVKYSWTAIVKKAETKDYVYLYLSAAQAIVIPKRILDTIEEKKLTDLLNRNLSLKAEFNQLYV